MARTSRTTRIVAEEGPPATGLTIDAAIDSYRLSLRAGNKPGDDRRSCPRSHRRSCATRSSRRSSTPVPGPTSTPAATYFADTDPDGKDRPAVDLVREYLDRLEAVVVGVEASFPRVVG